MGMSIQVKNFFENLDDKETFMFKKLYYQPEKVLGEKEDSTKSKKEYKNLFYYYDLMMNNNLSNFIISVFYDDDFMDRVEDNYQICKKLGCFLYDSRKFKKYYGIIEDKNLILTLKGKLGINEYLDKKKPKFPIMKSYNVYKKYEQLYEHSYPKEQIDSYDEYKSKEASSYLYFIGEAIRENESKKRNKQYSLTKLLEEDYTLDSYDSDNYLYKHSLDNIGLDSRALEDLVCENKFLEIIEEKINSNKIEGQVIDNVINIIYTGIDIKTKNSSYSNFYRGRVGEKNVKNYNIDYAMRIINKLLKIKNKQYKKRNLLLILK